MTDNIIDFKPKTMTVGGGDDWLSPLLPGTVFLCQTVIPQGPGDFGVQRFTVYHKYPQATMLLNDLNEQNVTFIVDNKRFCNHFRKTFIISEPQE